MRLGSTILLGTGVTIKYSEKVYHLNCRQCRDDGRGAEAVGDHGEVGEGSLDAWVQDRLGAGVAQGGPVLVQQVHQLLANYPGDKKSKSCGHLSLFRQLTLMHKAALFFCSSLLSLCIVC